MRAAGGLECGRARLLRDRRDGWRRGRKCPLDGSDTSFRWDGSQWLFNMSTANLSSGVKVKYYIPLNDGTYIFFTFGLK